MHHPRFAAPKLLLIRVWRAYAYLLHQFDKPTVQIADCSTVSSLPAQSTALLTRFKCKKLHALNANCLEDGPCHTQTTTIHVRAKTATCHLLLQKTIPILCRLQRTHAVVEPSSRHKRRLSRAGRLHVRRQGCQRAHRTIHTGFPIEC